MTVKILSKIENLFLRGWGVDADAALVGDGGSGNASSSFLDDWRVVLRVLIDDTEGVEVLVVLVLQRMPTPHTFTAHCDAGDADDVYMREKCVLQQTSPMKCY